MAEDVMVEQDPNAGLLAPIGVPASEALGGRTKGTNGTNGTTAGTAGFSPN